MDLVGEIISDSFLNDIIDNPDEISYKEVEELLPGVHDFKLFVQFYKGNYDFTDEELLELSEYLRYTGSKRIIEILILMKYREDYFDFRNKISIYLYEDYDRIKYYRESESRERRYWGPILIKEPVKYAMSHNLTHLVYYFIRKRVLDNDNFFILAMEFGNYEFMKLLIDKVSNVQEYWKIALINTAKDGYTDCFILVFERFIKLKNMRSTQLRNVAEDTLCWAASRYNWEIVKYILDKGIIVTRNYEQEFRSI